MLRRYKGLSLTKKYKVSMIPQSQIADKPMAPREEQHNHQETTGRQTKQSNQLSLLHQDDCKTTMGIK